MHIPPADAEPDGADILFWGRIMDDLPEWAQVAIIVVPILVLCIFGVIAKARQEEQNDERIKEIKRQKLKSTGAHGSARFADAAEHEAKGRFEAKGIYCGRTSDSDQQLYFNGHGHILTVGGTRAGKGTRLIVPNLLNNSFDGSTVVIDPKGELAAITHEARKEAGHKVFFLNPWGLHGLPSMGLNPFDCLDPKSPSLISDARLMANLIMVTDARGSQSANYFNESAEQLINMMILYVACCEPASRRNFIRLRQLINGSPADWRKVIEKMSKTRKAYGTLKEGANRLAMWRSQDKGAGFSGILSTAQQQIDFLAGPEMQKALKQSDFAIKDAIDNQATIYLIIPANRISGYRRWLRLMIGTIILNKYNHIKGKRMLFILDEFAALGKMQQIEDGIAEAAGHGVQLWPIVQDLSQLKKNYDDKWESFIANCECKLFLGIRDMFTAKYISQMCGKATVVVESYNMSRSSGDSETRSRGANYNESTGTNAGASDGHNMLAAGRELITPDEVVSLPEGSGIGFMGTSRPTMLALPPYYEVPVLASLAADNPYHQTASPQSEPESVSADMRS